MTKIFLPIYFIFQALSVKAQIPDYYVYSFIGEITCLRNGHSPQLIQSKYLLYSTDILTATKATVTLVDKNDNFYEVEVKNKLLLSSLNKPTNNTKPLIKKYLHFLWEEFFKKSENSNEFLRKKMNSIAGEIKTSGDDKNCYTERYPPEDVVLEPGKLVFSWTPFGDERSYQFTILDKFSNEVYTTVIFDTVLLIDSKNFTKAEISTYFWNVESNNDNKLCKSDFWEFRLLDKLDSQKINLIETEKSNIDVLAYLEIIDTLDKRKMYTKVIEIYEYLIQEKQSDNFLFALFADYLSNHQLQLRALNLLRKKTE